MNNTKQASFLSFLVALAVVFTAVNGHASDEIVGQCPSTNNEYEAYGVSEGVSDPFPCKKRNRLKVIEARDRCFTNIVDESDNLTIQCDTGCNIQDEQIGHMPLSKTCEFSQEEMNDFSTVSLVTTGEEGMCVFVAQCRGLVTCAFSCFR